MTDFRYPAVDIEFLEQMIMASGKLEKGGIQKLAGYTKYFIEGRQAIHKRTITANEVGPGQTGFEQSIGIAIKFKFLPALLDWLEKHRNWRDGAYFVPETQN